MSSRSHHAGFALALVAIAATSVFAQQPTSDPLNFGFERTGLITPTSPAKWYVGGQGYSVTLDSTEAQSGTHSLRIQASGAPPERSFGVASMSIPGPLAAGANVTLRGYIRTERITQGYAGLWVRIDSGTTMLVIDNMGSRGVTGTTPWTPYEVTLHADRAATNVVFGALHPGDGIAWFDSFSLTIDGKPVGVDAGMKWHANKDEAKWVHDHAIPLTTPDPKAPLTDLRPIGAIVGDAHIVSLGEGTHGTSEFFQMKHRLTRYLAEEKGFTVFAIEANMPEARRVNEYVLTGRGDPKLALSGMYFWTWNTQEVLDMIEWMRAYNASGKGRMEFWGFDLQTPEVAMDSVRAFVRRADAAYSPALDSAYGNIGGVVRERRANTTSAVAVNYWEAEAERVLAHLEKARDAYVAAGRDSLDVAWAIQNARIVVQAARSTRGTGQRDSAMALNVQWIAAHHPAGTKMVLWAHNAHVARTPGWMGAHLAEHYGSAIRVIGFSLGDGNFTAMGPRGLNTYPAAAPEAGTYEEVFRATGIPRFALDLRGVAAKPESRFLAEPHEFRSIGSMATDNQFFASSLASQFDAVIFFDHTNASARLLVTSHP